MYPTDLVGMETRFSDIYGEGNSITFKLDSNLKERNKEGRERSEERARERD